MKVKFLVPDIDRKKWASNFSQMIKMWRLKSKDLNSIGAEANSEQLINKLKNGSIPSMDRFLSICRFLNTTPDMFLSPIPKWVECEIDDLSVFQTIGKFGRTYYHVPHHIQNPVFPENKHDDYTDFKGIKTLSERPKLKDYCDFHIYDTQYYLYEVSLEIKEENDHEDYFYHLPRVNDEKTSKKIFSLFSQYKISETQAGCLLGLSKQSLINRKNGNCYWTIKDILKLSWIFNKKFEDLLVIDEHEDIHSPAFYPPFYLGEDYNEEEEKAEAEIYRKANEALVILESLGDTANFNEEKEKEKAEAYRKAYEALEALEKLGHTTDFDDEYYNQNEP